MYCPKCGSEIKAGVIFCGKCGCKVSAGYEAHEKLKVKRGKSNKKAFLIILVAAVLVAVSLTIMHIVIPTEKDAADEIKNIREAFVAAGKINDKWFLPETFNSGAVELSGKTYKPVREDITTMDGLYSELENYFTDEACENIVQKSYIEKDGKLFFYHAPFGIEDTYYITGDNLTKEDGEYIYEVYYKQMRYDGECEDLTFETKVSLNEGKYLFDRYGISFIRISGGIEDVYINQKEQFTVDEINALAIETAYKYLIDTLHYNGDSYCEYIIHDMDEDGTTELIYKKGTCEADAKMLYYTYDDGKIVKLYEGGGGHSAIYKTESGKGVYRYYAHMGFETKSLFTKVGNKIEEERVFERDGAASSENYSPPDAKDQFKTFKYNDYTGIEDLVFVNAVANTEQ